jgi:GDPmannose 4,6-dehydratase
MNKPIAIIVGGTGQFGINISNLLLKKKYKVIITTRFLKKKKLIKRSKNLNIYKLDVYNKTKIKKIIDKYNPNIIFYLAGQSSPKKSFILKKETYKSNVLGCKNILDILNSYKNQNCKFLNAASCEIYGNASGKININSFKRPVNPYGKAKLESFKITKKFREIQNLKTYNAVIFNTESYLREINYLIPKICIAAIEAKKFNKKTKFGNINVSREWNWCEEQSKYMLKFLEKKPQDFILSNGKNFSVRKMLKFAFDYFKLDYKRYILIDKKFFRPRDVKIVKSNYSYCLKRNGIKRKNSIYGQKIIQLLIKNYLKKYY